MVSVIIVNYNTPDLTLNCVKSVLKFTHNIDYEIIVVDNASPKNKIIADDYKDYKCVKVVFSESNLGFAGGNNLGLKYAVGDLVLLLNSDTILKDNAIKIAADKFAEMPRCGALTVRLVYPDGNLQYPAQRCPSLRLELRELFRINKFTKPEKKSKLYLGGAFAHDIPTNCDWIFGTFFLTSKSVIDSVLGGKFPDDFFMYAEDMQWCFMLLKHGFQPYFCPDAEVIHLGGASMDKTSEVEKYYKSMFPNTFAAVAQYKGKFHTKLIYFVRILHLLTLRNAEDRYKAKKFWEFLKNA